MGFKKFSLMASLFVALHARNQYKPVIKALAGMSLLDAIKLCIFDLDGTAVQYNSGSFQSSWDAVGIASGKEEEWMRRRDYYYPKPDLYQEWFDGNCRLLAGVEVQPILDKVLPPPYTPGFLEFCAYAKSEGVKLGLVSSGVDLVANRIKEDAGLDFVVANMLHVTEGKFTGTGEQHVPLWGKGEIIKRYLALNRTNFKQAAYFGDHENDRGAWSRVGLRIGINLKHQDLHSQVDYSFKDFHGALELFQKIAKQ